VVVSDKIIPPWHMMGLDLSGGDAGGITLSQAVALNCQGIDAGPGYAGGWVTAWGDAGQASFYYDIASGRYEQALATAGYSGTMTWTSSDSHVYVAKIGAPITKDGATFKIDWQPNADAGTTQATLDAQITELCNGLVNTFAPGTAPFTNCRAQKGCGQGANIDAAHDGYFTCRPIRLGFYFPHAGDTLPTTSTPGLIYLSNATSYNDFTQPSAWTTFDTTKVSANAKGFRGVEFDGAYLYLVPNASGALVTRYNTTQPSSFTDTASWATFDTTTVDPGAKGFSGGAFDYQFVYFAPSANGVVARYDTTSTFQLPSAWSTFNTATMTPPASQFAGAVYSPTTGATLFVPAANGVAAVWTAGSTLFNDTTAWATLDLSTIDARLKQFRGGAALSQYVYLAPHGAGPIYPGLAVQWNANAGFTASAFQTMDLSTVDANQINLFAFADAVSDGARYIYYVPASNGVGYGDVMRYDTTLGFNDKTAWSFFNISPNNFTTGAWDGRYLYLSGSSSVVYRYDSTASFTDSSSWSAFDVSTVGSGALAFFGSLFDGRYLFFVPDTFSTLTRLDAKFPPFGVSPQLATFY
jgi:hypothetical protein